MELTKKEEQGARLYTLINALRLTQTEFSKQIGISQAYISKVITGEKSVSYRVINGITRGFAMVNISWLMEGDGDMFSSKKNETKSNGVSEPEVKYEARPADPLSALRKLLDDHERRLAELEREVRWLRGEDEEEKG